MNNYIKNITIKISFIALMFYAGLISFTTELSYGMEEPSQQETLANVPPEVLIEIFNKLQPHEALNFSIVSRWFHSILCNPEKNLLMEKKLKNTPVLKVLGFCWNRLDSFKDSLIISLKEINPKHFPLDIQLKILLAQYSATRNPNIAKEFIKLYDKTKPPATFVQVYLTMKKHADEEESSSSD